MAYAPKSHTLTDPLQRIAPVKPRRTRNSCKGIHIKKLIGFYKDKVNFNILFDIVNQNSLLSLRLCEFVCTHLARKGLITKSLTGEDVHLDSAYQAARDWQGKSMFDPFCRDPLTKFKLNMFDKSTNTNVAQMRFIKFAIVNGVIAYALKNFRVVESKMSIHTAEMKKERALRCAGKRKLTTTQKSPKIRSVAGVSTTEMGSPKVYSSPKRKRIRPYVHSRTVRMTFSPSFMSSAKDQRVYTIPKISVVSDATE
jgi:hypothetical protein